MVDAHQVELPQVERADEGQAAGLAAVAQAVVATIATLRTEMEREPKPAGGSRSPVGHHRQSPSPKRRHGRCGRSPMLQTVYRDSRAGTPWSMLTKSNYHEWSLLMKVKLQALRLWEAGRRFTLGGSRSLANRRALEALCTAVPTELGASLAKKATTKLA